MSELPADNQMENLNKMKVADIKKLLKSQGLSTHGNKSELIQRLKTSTPPDSFLETSATVDNEVFDEDLEEDLDETELMSDEKEDVVDKQQSHNNKTPRKDQVNTNSPTTTTDTDIKTTNKNVTVSENTSKEESGKLTEEEEEEEEEEEVDEEMMEEDRECHDTPQPSTQTHQEPSPNSPLHKHNGGGEDGGSQTEGGHAPSSTSSSLNNETPQADQTEKHPTESLHTRKMIKISDMSTTDKLAKRAEKFGLTEAAKKEMRAARFGIQTPASMSELMKKRAERFGLPAATIENTKVSLSMIGETEKAEGGGDVLKKRAKRFALASTTANKVEKKSIVFGGVRKTAVEDKSQKGKLQVAALKTVSPAERRLMRSVRFKVATTT